MWKEQTVRTIQISVVLIETQYLLMMMMNCNFLYPSPLLHPFPPMFSLHLFFVRVPLSAFFFFFFFAKKHRTGSSSAASPNISDF